VRTLKRHGLVNASYEFSPGIGGRPPFLPLNFVGFGALRSGYLGLAGGELGHLGTQWGIGRENAMVVVPVPAGRWNELRKPLDELHRRKAEQALASRSWLRRNVEQLAILFKSKTGS